MHSPPLFLVLFPDPFKPMGWRCSWTQYTYPTNQRKWNDIIQGPSITQPLKPISAKITQSLSRLFLCNLLGRKEFIPTQRPLCPGNGADGGGERCRIKIWNSSSQESFKLVSSLIGNRKSVCPTKSYTKKIFYRHISDYSDQSMIVSYIKDT